MRGSLLQLSSQGDSGAGESLPLQTGRARALSRASNSRNEGSIPSAPATYVNDATGEPVDETWWPDAAANGHPPINPKED